MNDSPSQAQLESMSSMFTWYAAQSWNVSLLSSYSYVF